MKPSLARTTNERSSEAVGTVREESNTRLHDLADKHPDQLVVEQVDISDSAQLVELRDRLAHRRFEILFNDAGTANRNQDETITEVSTDEFAHVMVTNALGPMRVVETLQGLVTAKGLIAVMSSGQAAWPATTRAGMKSIEGRKPH